MIKGHVPLLQMMGYNVTSFQVGSRQIVTRLVYLQLAPTYPIPFSSVNSTIPSSISPSPPTFIANSPPESQREAMLIEGEQRAAALESGSQVSTFVTYDETNEEADKKTQENQAGTSRNGEKFYNFRKYARRSPRTRQGRDGRSCHDTPGFSLTDSSRSSANQIVEDSDIKPPFNVHSYRLDSIVMPRQLLQVPPAQAIRT